MVAHARRAIFLALLLPLGLVAACDKVPLLAPTGSVITLIPSSLTVPNNSQVQIIATVIEHGAASGGSGAGNVSTPSSGGTPVQNGTLVTFTTTLGRIEPAEARTHNGQVTVTLYTGSESGSPTITAYSGGATSTNTDIKIGAAAAKTVNIAAAPSTLGSAGGTSTITASVINEAGGGVSGVPVTFTTDQGTLSASTVTTDASGNASTQLTTSATAKVSATSGTVTTANPVTVTVSPAAISSFSANPPATTAGVPVSFTVTPNTNANVQNVHVEFGDGSGTDLGAISSASSAQHAYCSPGTYTATATATSATGGSGSLSTQVIIGALPLTLANSGNTVSSPITFTASGVGSAQVSQYTWTTSEGTTRDTSAPQTTFTFNTRGQKTVRIDAYGVSGCRIGTQSITIDVQ
jgi:hypothetical protein